MNLSELDIARLKYPLEDQCVADFAANLDHGGAVRRVAEE